MLLPIFHSNSTCTHLLCSSISQRTPCLLIWPTRCGRWWKDPINIVIFTGALCGVIIFVVFLAFLWERFNAAQLEELNKELNYDLAKRGDNIGAPRVGFEDGQTRGDALVARSRV